MAIVDVDTPVHVTTYCDRAKNGTHLPGSFIITSAFYRELWPARHEGGRQGCFHCRRELWGCYEISEEPELTL